jgi:hypothetical protein
MSLLGSILKGAKKGIGAALKLNPNLAGINALRGAIKQTGRILKGGGGTVLPDANTSLITGTTSAMALPAIGGALMRTLPALRSAMPGVGARVGAIARNPFAQGVAGSAVGGMLFDAAGNPVARRRRRGRGFTARDIRQTRRMLRLIHDMSRAVPRKRC